jgi:hypothetical protein
MQGYDLSCIVKTSAGGDLAKCVRLHRSTLARCCLLLDAELQQCKAETCVSLWHCHAGTPLHLQLRQLHQLEQMQLLSQLHTHSCKPC